jgi:hypothetical protein
VFRVGQKHRHNSHQTRVDTALSSQGPRGNNDSEVLHINNESTSRSVFMLCFAYTYLSYCMCWKLTDIITRKWTILTMDFLHNLM